MTIETEVAMKVLVKRGTPKAAPANPAITPEYRQRRAERETRREALATKRIRASHDKAVALGIIDESGKRLKATLPADMQPGSDRDFGG
jgi:hypothetical protein